jgi:hypothetical protein
MDNEHITISRLRYEVFTFLGISGWLMAFFLLGVLLGDSK